MAKTANLGLVKSDANVSILSGNTATGESFGDANADLIDTSLAALGGAGSASGISVVNYAASGAIAQKSGVVTISKAGVAAMTLAAPTSGADDGKELKIISLTAFAHTVVGAVGYSGGSNKTATFAAAIGNLLRLIALGGVWYQLPSTGITISA